MRACAFEHRGFESSLLVPSVFGQDDDEEEDTKLEVLFGKKKAC